MEFSNVSFPMFYHDNSISHYLQQLNINFSRDSDCAEHSRVAANLLHDAMQLPCLCLITHFYDYRWQLNKLYMIL